MNDRYQNNSDSPESPAVHVFAIAPSDATDLAEITRAIYVGQHGNVRLTLLSGATVTFTNLASGTVLAVRAQRVLSTSTTATDLIGLV